MKKLLLLIILSSSAYSQKASTPELRNLDSRLLHLEYEQLVERCFTALEFCRLKGGEEDQCWKKHEACVINETKKYEFLRKRHGL